MALLQELDTGTPIRTGEATVTLTIDGRKVSVPPGTSVMAAAALIDNPIPKLCATDSVEAFGSCRLCLVEIEGRKGTPASCTTPAEAGMIVRTKTPRLERLRKGVMELYISDHPLDCLTCSANNDCELQAQAGNVGLRDVRYGYDGANHLKAPTDASNPYFTFESSKCIVCSRCVRACEEVQGTFALTILGRGFDSKVGTGGVDFLSSECVSCGACVQACPTATLNEKLVIEKGTPERTVVTTCAYCGVGCSFKAELKGDEVLRMVPYKAGKANEGHSCVKGRFAYGYATHKDRVLKPMIRERIEDPWREVSWDDAIAYAANEFRRIQAKYGRDSVGAISSSRCTNEEVFLVQKMVRAGFGNNNIDTCARVCHSPTGFGLSKTFGTSAGTQDFKSVEKTDVVVVIGANPTDAHPVFGSRMKKRLRAGARLIVIDPRRTRSGQEHAHQGRLSSRAEARNQRRRPQRLGACHRHRGPRERGVRPRALRPCQFQVLGALRRRSASFARGDGGGRAASTPASCARLRVFLRPAATARSITGLASPSTARARPR